MYEAFYGLTSKPFQLNPDPNFFFGSKQHRRAKAYLEYGVSRNEGFIVITGEIGAGKTTVLRSLIDGLHGSNVIAGHLVTTQLGAEDTLRMVGAAFGFRVKDVPKSELLITLEAFLISQTSKGKRCLLIVDEAQNLTPHEVKTIVSRVGEGTKLILTGDIGQIDNPYLDSSSNGLSYAIEKMKGVRLFGHVTLAKSERSELASIAANRL